MRRRDFLALSGASAVAWPLASRAQQRTLRKRVTWIHNLPETDPDAPALFAAFGDGLMQQGWITGDSVDIDARWSIDTVALAEKILPDVVATRPEVICVNGDRALPFVRAIKDVPIVFAFVNDPLEAGVVDSLTRPGGNATGYGNLEASIAGKWLDLLLVLAPNTEQAGYLTNPDNPTGARFYAAFAAAAGRSGVTPRTLIARTAGEIVPALGPLGVTPHSGLVTGNEGFIIANRGPAIAEATRLRLPSVWGHTIYASSGAAVSYGIDAIDLTRRWGEYAGRVLNGERIAALPVQSPNKFQLILSLKAAKAQGLSLPQSLLILADQIVE